MYTQDKPQVLTTTYSSRRLMREGCGELVLLLLLLTVGVVRSTPY